VRDGGRGSGGITGISGRWFCRRSEVLLLAALSGVRSASCAGGAQRRAAQGFSYFWHSRRSGVSLAACAVAAGCSYEGWPPCGWHAKITARRGGVAASVVRRSRRLQRPGLTAVHSRPGSGWLGGQARHVPPQEKAQPSPIEGTQFRQGLPDSPALRSRSRAEGDAKLRRVDQPGSSDGFSQAGHQVEVVSRAG